MPADDRQIESSAGHSRLLGWLLILALLILWELVTWSGLVVSSDFPPLSDILSAWRDMILKGNGLTDIRTTLQRALTGYSLAILIGVSLGTVMGTWSLADALLEPIIELIRPIPVTALVPLVILFLGIGHELKIFIAFLGSFFPILINTHAGTRSVSVTLRQTAMTFRLTKLQQLRKITLPAAAPSIFVGLRLGLTISMIVTVVTEMIAGNSGMGYFVLHGQQMMLMPELYAGVFTLAVAGYSLNVLFILAERHLLFWSERVRTAQN